MKEKYLTGRIRGREISVLRTLPVPKQGITTPAALKRAFCIKPLEILIDSLLLSPFWMIWGDLNQQFDLTFYIFHHSCGKLSEIQDTSKGSTGLQDVTDSSTEKRVWIRMNSKMHKESTRRTLITLMRTVWGYLFSSSSWLRSSTFSLSAASTIARSWSIFASISSTC